MVFIYNRTGLKASSQLNQLIRFLKPCINYLEDHQNLKWNIYFFFIKIFQHRVSNPFSTECRLWFPSYQKITHLHWWWDNISPLIICEQISLWIHLYLLLDYFLWEFVLINHHLYAFKKRSNYYKFHYIIFTNWCAINHKNIILTIIIILLT